jgi:hypothetical protein
MGSIRPLPELQIDALTFTLMRLRQRRHGGGLDPNDGDAAMTDRPWFRKRANGFGWTPVTWEGWLVTVLGAAVVAAVDIAPGCGVRLAGTTLVALAPA